ncbi:MAG: LPS assembly lipoprotein LptE [Rikenellaceae bacterium]|nr:LPS assembly lipoprotein LptE [Rikenellaceae bacterium]
MNIRKILLLVIGGLFIITGCKVSYSLSGASISPDVKTVSVAYFPNSATMVSPILSSTFTDELQSKFARQTKLIQVREEGDLAFEGEIIGYTSTPTAVTAEEYATKNRLTITVRVRFANRIEPEYSFERNFSAYEEYDSNRMLSDAESELIPAIVEQLVDDIFNAAVSNW